MPDVPEAALVAAESAIRDAFPGEFSQPGMPEPDALARAALDAAAPLLAEACASAILAHMEAHGPPAEAPGVTRHEVLRRAWRRHFGIAARVAAGAFYTREDELRLAAEAISEGRFIACHPPEG